MEFALSEDQRALQEGLRSALQRACPLSTVRAAAEGQPPDALWATACELGLPAMLVPEAQGGLGLSLLDAALAAEELGRQAAPVPFLGTAVLAVLALKEGGSAHQQDAWLGRLARGEARLGIALAEALSGARDDAGVDAVDGRLHGSALFVVDGAGADGWLVAARDGSLYLVDRSAHGVTSSPLRMIDGTRPCVELRFEATPAQRLVAGDGALLERLRDAASVILAADALGAGWTMIEHAVAYARDRRQFGRPIGSFQAVKHLCAEMAASLEVKRALVWFAAHAFDEKLEGASLYAAHAKAQVGEAAQFAARGSIEVHGGMGITDELGLHLWFKRIEFDRQFFGGPAQACRHAAALQGLL
jgi:alkylation response protein AidB-like acyl-CoA dehydrogenase